MSRTFDDSQRPRVFVSRYLRRLIMERMSRRHAVHRIVHGRRGALLGVLVLPVLASCGASTEAEALGSITGHATVADGVGVPDATITVSFTDSKSIETDESGFYSFEGVAPGTYYVEISEPPPNVRFETTEKAAILTESKSHAEVDFQGEYTRVEIVTTELPAPFVDFEYGVSLEATGGDAAYTWEIVGGAVPDGIGLSTETGELSGTATAHETSTFTVRATSGDGQAADREFSVTTMLHPTARCSGHPEDAIATFQDPALESAVRGAIALEPHETLTCAHLATLGVLGARQYGITRLEGVQNLTGLTHLSLGLNDIRDLKPLRELSALEDLDLRYNAIADVTPLGRLTRLRNLDLEGNEISVIDALADLRDLTHLRLDHNAISDVGVIGELTNLEWLWLRQNAIRDVAALGGLTELWSLQVSGNQIHDMSAVAGLTKLQSLSVDENAVHDLGPLSGLSALENLRAGHNSISDVTPLSGLSALTLLVLRDNSIIDIAPLAALTGLGVLDVRQNRITDLSPIGSLTHLTSALVGGNPATDISALGRITSLTTLSVGASPVADVSPLGALTGLTYLDLYDNPNLTDIGPLSGLIGLEWLNLEGGVITDVTALSTLTNIYQLKLEGNADLADIQPLLANTGLGAGDKLWLEGTSVSCEDISALRSKGVTVFAAC